MRETNRFFHTRLVQVMGMGSSSRVWWAGGLVLLTVGTYASGLDIPYYADDLQLYFPAAKLHWAAYLVTADTATGFYRPLQNVFLALMQSWMGMNPVPVHLVTLVLHLAVVGVVYEGGRWMGLSRRGAGVAAAVMALGQANVAAVLGNDTLSQVGATLFGYLALRLYGASHWDGNSPSPLGFWGGLVALGTALLFKESGIAFVLPLLALEGRVGGHYWQNEKRTALYRSLGRGGVLLLVVAGYLIGRTWTGAVSPGFGPGPYQYDLGVNLLRNAALFGAAATSVVPTTSVAQWAQEGAMIPLMGALVLSGGLVFAVGYGVYRGRRWARGLVLLGLAGMSLGPVLPLNNVSELYVYSAMPPLSLLAGMGIDEALTAVSAERRRMGVLLVGVFLCVQVGGVYQKSVLMENTGDRMHAVLPALVDHARAAPAGAALCLQTPPRHDTTAYSIYRMPGALPFHFAESVLRHRARRPDLAFSVGTPDCTGTMSSSTVVRLRLRKQGWGVERVRPVPAPESSSLDIAPGMGRALPDDRYLLDIAPEGLVGPLDPDAV